MPSYGSGSSSTSETTSAQRARSLPVRVGKSSSAASAGEVSLHVPPERTNGASARLARLLRRRSISSPDRPVSFFRAARSPSWLDHDPASTSGARTAAYSGLATQSGLRNRGSSAMERMSAGTLRRARATIASALFESETVAFNASRAAARSIFRSSILFPPRTTSSGSAIRTTRCPPFTAAARSVSPSNSGTRMRGIDDSTSRCHAVPSVTTMVR